MTLHIPISELPLTVSEHDFQAAVIDVAHYRGWRVMHQRPALTRRDRWTTATQGHTGWPDLALARGGVFIAAELKRTGGRPTPAQKAWLTQLGEHGRLWYPNMWPEILMELR
jgi:hypothetical protein